VQTIVVSLVALAALGLVVRRLVGAIRPPRGQAGCPSCASGSDSCGTAAATAGAASGTPDVRPLILIKSKSR
jgi:hypothetical protein